MLSYEQSFTLTNNHRFIQKHNNLCYLCINKRTLMNVKFQDPQLRSLFDTGTSKHGIYRTLARDTVLMKAFFKAVRFFADAPNISIIKQYSPFHYEKLKYRQESSIRLVNGRVERLLFIEHDDEITITIIEIDTKHYGTKR